MFFISLLKCEKCGVPEIDQVELGIVLATGFFPIDFLAKHRNFLFSKFDWL